mmetsp:Transcript_17575/g.48756  ORF Transcript_17575/g.48756 Transcript_17575/m.48756 type:complete len:201 (+) Transcript_17575:350-952(+)
MSSVSVVLIARNESQRCWAEMKPDKGTDVHMFGGVLVLGREELTRRLTSGDRRGSLGGRRFHNCEGTWVTIFIDMTQRTREKEADTEITFDCGFSEFSECSFSRSVLFTLWQKQKQESGRKQTSGIVFALTELSHYGWSVHAHDEGVTQVEGESHPRRTRDANRHQKSHHLNDGGLPKVNLERFRVFCANQDQKRWCVQG